jgi:hypothetical protein
MNWIGCIVLYLMSFLIKTNAIEVETYNIQKLGRNELLDEIEMNDQIIISINGNESKVMTRSDLCCVPSGFLQNLLCDKSRNWNDGENKSKKNDTGIIIYSLDDDDFIAFDPEIIQAILDAVIEQCIRGYTLHLPIFDRTDLELKEHFLFHWNFFSLPEAPLEEIYPSMILRNSKDPTSDDGSLIVTLSNMVKTQSYKIQESINNSKQNKNRNLHFNCYTK